MGMPPPSTEELTLAATLHGMGVKQSTIAVWLCVSRSTIKRWLKEDIPQREIQPLPPDLVLARLSSPPGGYNAPH